MILPFVIASDLAVKYSISGQDLVAIEKIDLSVDCGEIVSIVGPSGCGKTTLLRVIAGLLQPLTGKITINEMIPTKYRSDNPIGFMFQKPVLFPWRSIISNIQLPLEISNRKFSHKSDDSAKKILHNLGLGDFENAYPSQLSGGMLQRVALARALISNPSLLLLDEPFSALDEITREQLWIDFRKILVKKNISVILVTHSIREAVFLSDKVLVMSKRPGHIINSVNISLPPSREHETTTNSEFIYLTEKVREALLC